MSEVRVVIAEIEGYKHIKSELSKEELEFLNKEYLIEYNNETTIKAILNFLIYGVRNYYKKYKNLEFPISEYNLKMSFMIKYNQKSIRIFDLDTKIENILKAQNNNKVEVVMCIVGCGGFDAIETIDGIKFEMKTHEQGKHNQPHLHVKYSGEEAIVNILTGKIITGKIKKKKQAIAVEKIIENKENLIFLWDTRTDGTKINIDTNDFYLSC